MFDNMMTSTHYTSVTDRQMNRKAIAISHVWYNYAW